MHIGSLLRRSCCGCIVSLVCYLCARKTCDSTKVRTSMKPPRMMRMCPHCRCTVRREKFDEHVKKVHPVATDIFAGWTTPKQPRSTKCKESCRDSTAAQRPPDTERLSSTLGHPLFLESRDGFKVPKQLEAGMRGKLNECRDRLCSALKAFDIAELNEIRHAMRAAKELAAVLREIIDYRATEKAKVELEKAKSNCLQNRRKKAAESATKHVAVAMPQRRVKLRTRQGNRVEARGECDVCFRSTEVLWHYLESDLGAVRLCGLCNATALDRSFGKRDALDGAFSGGAFGQNRR